MADQYILTLFEIPTLLNDAEENIFNCSLDGKAKSFFENLIIQLVSVFY